MKRLHILTILAALTLLLCCLLPTKAEAATSGYYTYTVFGRKATITDCSTTISGDITIPSTLGGYPVTSIGNYAFSDCRSLISITIPDSVTGIGVSAFEGCSSLIEILVDDGNSYYSSDARGVLFNKDKTSLIAAPGGITDNYTVPDTVTSIGDRALSCCGNMTSVTIPESVTSIGYNAFYNCSSLTKVHFNATNCTSMGDADDSVFGFCMNLKTINIGRNVRNIPDAAFAHCYGLTSITIPSSVTSIGEYVFWYCTSLTEILVEEGNPNYSNDEKGVLFDKNKTSLIAAPCGISDSYTIPGSVNSISEAAFVRCGSLTRITIPDGVTSIGEYAFRDCSNLTGITIPDSVTIIGPSAFSDCSSLTSITIPDSVTSIGYYAFSGCESLTHVAYTGTESQWSSISVGDRNNPLTNATRHYETAFQTTENCVAINIYCPVCQIDLTSIAKPNGAHTFRAATCTEPKTCTVCGAVEGEALGHSFGTWVQTKAPTCTEAGEEKRTCICGETEIRPVAADGHSYEAVVTAPTCTEKGFTTHTCEACGDVKITDYVAATGHSFRAWAQAKAPTCTEAGEEKRTCVCGEAETRPLAATGHSGELWFELVAPTCVADGMKARICAVCNETEVVTVAAFGHSYTSIVTAPTCTEQGYTTNTCTVCGEVSVTDRVEAAGHSYNAVITMSTCTEQGYTTKTCSVCGDVTVTDYVPAKGHGWSAWIQTAAPSCKKEGFRLRFCNCGTRETEAIQKLPHSYANDVCTACGDIAQYDWVLTENTAINRTLAQDLYIDLNGFDLTGTIVTNGFKVYGMDSTTDGYTCDSIGYFTCVDENGNLIVPERICANGEKQYMAIASDKGYSFHRFFVGVTHMSLEPEVVGLGYKSAIFGDEMVMAQLAENKAFSFRVQLEGYNPVYRHFDGSELASGAPITLRIRNYDVENYSEHNLYAQVSLTLNDGTVIETEQVSLTFRWLTEQVNASYTDYTSDQLTQFKTMLQAFDIVKKWDIPNLI